MGRVGVVSLLLVLCGNSSLQAQTGSSPAAGLVRADEAGARLTLHEKTAVFSLPVSSELAEAGPVEFTAQIVAPDDKVIAKQSAMLAAGEGNDAGGSGAGIRVRWECFARDEQSYPVPDQQRGRSSRDSRQ